MKFGKTIVEKTLNEWKFYSVDYKQLKKNIKQCLGDDGQAGDATEFFETLKASEEKLVSATSQVGLELSITNIYNGSVLYD